MYVYVFTDQEERQWAIREFKEDRKDVLVATDIASKGLDFPNIQHVINYDMPADIENYGIIIMHVHSTHTLTTFPARNPVCKLCTSYHSPNISTLTRHK